VTRDSQVVWRYLNPVTDSNRLYQGDTIPNGMSDKQNSTFRITRYAPDYPGFAGKDLTPGYPIERYASPMVGVAEQKHITLNPRTALTATPNLGPGRSGENTLDVFAVDGRLVRALTLTGSRVTWDGTDNAGQQVCPGIYCCRLRGHDSGRALKLVKVN
jgi:hypothetical protein